MWDLHSKMRSFCDDVTLLSLCDDDDTVLTSSMTVTSLGGLEPTTRSTWALFNPSGLTS